MSCEGCSLRFTIFKRKKKCEDCGFVFCSDCSKGGGRQCYRCKVLTCVPLNGVEVASLRLRDLQWFLESKGVSIPAGQLREKPALVDWVMNYRQKLLAPPAEPLYPLLRPDEGCIGGLFGSAGSTASTNTGAASHTQANLGSEKNRDEKSTEINQSRHKIITLDNVNSRDNIFELSTMELKVLLTRNFISFRGCCEKSELQEKVCWLWDIKESAKTKVTIPDENLCKICMDWPIDSLFLDCGHMVTCTKCGKLLHDCPICRQIIVRVVRAFKS